MNYEDYGCTKIDLIKKVRKVFPNMSLNEAKKYVERMEKIADKFNQEVEGLSNFTGVNPHCVKAPCAAVACKETETKEADMRFYDDCDEDCEMNDTKNYLTNRLYNIRDKKSYDLQKTFGLRDDDPPNSINELVARIKDGKFTMCKGYDGTEIIYDPIRYVKWRDPAVKEDKSGYDKASKALAAVHQDALDTITVVTDEQALLKALKDFEAVTVQ